MVNEFCVPESIVVCFFFKIHLVYIFNILLTISLKKLMYMGNDFEKLNC